MPLLKVVSKMRARPLAHWMLWLRAFVWLGVMRAAINTLSMPRLLRHLRLVQTTSGDQQSLPSLPLSQRVRWAVTSASRYTPWKSDCLPQALTAFHLLRQDDVSTVLHLGTMFRTAVDQSSISSQGDRALVAHAWLKDGEYVVTGRSGHRSYATVAMFTASQK